MSESAQETQQTDTARAAAQPLEELLSGLDDDARKVVLGEVQKARGEAKGLRDRLKQAEPGLKELGELKAAQQTETERWQSFGQQQEARADKAEKDAIRFRVALQHGLTPDDLQFIHGDDESSILASAGALRARLGQTQTPQAPRSPFPDPSQGSSANGGAATDPGAQFGSLIQAALRSK